MIKYCFNEKTVSFRLSDLIYTKKLPTNYKSSQKYIQIKSTISALGLVEPILIYIDGADGTAKILDGHLRVEALKDIGEERVACLVSTVYDTYTPNKKVNRITIIQIQKMLKEAVRVGVPEDMLCSALNISSDSLKSNLSVLKGICPEVIELFNDRDIPKNTFMILKRMIPFRQIECANIMIKFDNYSKIFAQSLYHSSSPELLNDKGKPNIDERSGNRKAIERLEKEMAQVHFDTQKIKENYGSNSLKLTIVISHIKKILENPKVFHWLLRNKQDYLSELTKISDIEKLA
ncbi:ParB N-terminal domain-containing protein [Pantoea stewartii]|uniref:plasmid partitioning protein RepB C-terminal domain-containing protein n=1 Tax=Pantoea TaxID=53335 RepID=UPI000CF48D8D|nr:MULTISPECIES: plasmid partitioning protein RepB C-terminal domain-containing protein [Pantoea]MCU7366159.1 ParB N-terminal domain-containing protein [Pantoea stewartii]PQL06421.1 plasmid partitioning protein [Pantoea ananatis]